ncbi:ribonuclease H-like domain-containing protein [Tanacetum coccineum]
MSNIRCLISVAVKNKWPLWQLDVNNAFLYGDLEEDVYMSFPEGYRCESGDNKVCKLKKSMYGLKQAPRKWNEKLVGILSECGFKQSSNDHSLFVKAIGCVFVALLVYVDGILISGNDTSEIENIKTFLRKYCIKLLHEFGMLGCKPVSVPMEPNTVLNFKPSKEDPPLVNIIGYQKLLGKLIYLTHTRPDISYYVHCLSQHMHAPLKSHLDSAFHVLRVTIIGQNALRPENLCPDIVFFLMAVSYLGKAKNKQLFQNHLLKQNIGPWPLLRVK